MMRKNFIKERISESIKIRGEILHNQILLEKIEKFYKVVLAALKNGGKIIFFGNGGSASDSQHLACEFVVRFKKDRVPLPAIALSVNTSILTACSNDYSFERIFQRQIKALAKRLDVCVGISTSGNSSNVVAALREAKSMGVYSVGLTGLGGGKVGEVVDLLIDIPSKSTSHIQEAHILIGHIICELVEENF